MAPTSITLLDTFDTIAPFDLELCLADPVERAISAPAIDAAMSRWDRSPSGAPVASDADVQYWYDVGFAGPDRTYPATDRALTAAQLLAVGQGWTDGRAGAPRRTVP
jgi:hypothetical protein